MTKNAKSISAGERGRMSVGQILFCLMSAVAMLLTFRYSEVAISAMSAGMKLCVTTVIPSLFPFMVCSELLISSGAANVLGGLIGKPISALFGISREGAVALLLGFLCGFPIGMRSALSLYRRGRISRAELEHICTFCNNPSSAFLISAVGSSLFGSRYFGVLLYASHIISSCIIGFLGRFFFSAKKEKSEYFSSKEVEDRAPDGFIASFTRAVTGSASSMLFICAFVIFFSAVVGFLRFFAQRADLPDAAIAFMFGFFEMTGGVSAAAALPLSVAIPMAAAITGWSGLSVHFQLVGICGEHKFSLRPYFFSKITCALLNTAVISLLVRVFASKLSFDTAGSITSLILLEYSPLSLVSLALFVGGCAMLRRKF